MITPSTERLERLLGDEHLRWLLLRARSRLESGRPLTGVVILDNASEGQRSALAALIGRPVGSGRSVSVALDTVDGILRASGVSPEGLAAAIVALTGPVIVRRDAAEQLSEAWSRALEPLWRLASERAEFAGWVEDVAGAGLLKRMTADPDAGAALVLRVTDVLCALPSPGESLGRFAARVLGDAHALDPGGATSSLAIGALRFQAGLPSSTAVTAALRRELWGRSGVAVDELSSTVLIHALPSATASRTGAAFEQLRSAGHPVVVTLRQLIREDPFALDLDGVLISVCENPAVLAAAAEELGAGSTPLVCVSGHPSIAATRLLGGLVEAGASLRYHGDFDWGGIRIANSLWRRFPVQPWRFRTEDYEAAVSSSALPLTGSPAIAEWDAGLGVALTHHGVRVEEEQLISELLGDLG